MPDDRLDPTRLERLRELADRARVRESDIANCPHDGGTKLWARILTTGARVHYVGCARCSAPTGPGRFVKVTGDDDVPVALDERALRPPCRRCGAIGTQIHHWAPRAIFGPVEAECWPTDYLCEPCHSEWHNVMNAAIDAAIDAAIEGDTDQEKGSAS